MNRIILVIYFFLTGMALCRADDQEAFSLIIKDHQFQPAQLVVPAGRKITLIVDNQDATAEEWESYDLNREKMVAGHKKIKIHMGPLAAGPYKYFGDFHPQMARGVIVAR